MGTERLMVMRLTAELLTSASAPERGPRGC